MAFFWWQLSNKAKSEKPRLMTSRTIESPVGRLLAIASNAKNPIAIIIPCHRVTGAGNKIKGFAGGSAAVRGLLAIERKQPTGKGGSKDSHDH